MANRAAARFERDHPAGGEQLVDELLNGSLSRQVKHLAHGGAGTAIQARISDSRDRSTRGVSRQRSKPTPPAITDAIPCIAACVIAATSRNVGSRDGRAREYRRTARRYRARQADEQQEDQRRVRQSPHGHRSRSSRKVEALEHEAASLGQRQQEAAAEASAAEEMKRNEITARLDEWRWDARSSARGGRVVGAGGPRASTRGSEASARAVRRR
jgi:hypothetical protein